MAKSIRQSVEEAVEGRKDSGEPSSDFQAYLDEINKYDREFEKWQRRVERILKRYRDDTREWNRQNSEARFNILWSNVETLVPACFSRLPQPDVSRRFRDNDPTGRVAALILERALDFEIQHYTDYRTTLRQCVRDRFLGGRGTAWIRYEPHFKSKHPGKKQDGQITEDLEADTQATEALDYECAPIDYVHWRDFGHSVARTWEEVGCVWRRVYMDKDAVTERFGKEIAEQLPYDQSPDDLKRSARTAQENWKQQAVIYEIWDKNEGCAYWLSKSYKQFLDERDDPLGLQEFFPCPKPLFATITNETLVPIPDFTLYQDQANELDIYSDRIDGLTKMLQLKGVYDDSVPALGRLFTEGTNGSLVPAKNWAQFSEKGGLKGTLDLVDLTMIAEALRTAQEGMEQVKQQVYEITGISDIIRGQGEASETATATNIKGQYASLRLRSMQEDVARFATDILQLKAQVMCGKFSPRTIAAISAADQLTEIDEQSLPQAMALLVGPERLQDPEAEAPNPLRSFRIEVAADTLVQMDESQEKQDRLEFLKAVADYFRGVSPIIQSAPQSGTLFLELAKFGVTAFKVGKGIEGMFDAAIDQLKQQPPQQQPNPEMVKIQAQQSIEQAKLQHEGARLQMEAQAKERAAQLQAQVDQHRSTIEGQRDNFRIQAEMDFKKWQAELDARTKIEIAEITAKATLDAAQARAAVQAVDNSKAAN